MKSISIFNNKGGVGKTTLTFHVAQIMSEMGKKILIIDVDPQCNLTIMSVDEEIVHEMWAAEDPYISHYENAVRANQGGFEDLLASPRSVHFLLKPTEEGLSDPPRLPPPLNIAPNLDIIPGRLTLHLYEDKISSRWSDAFQGDPLALRTVTRIRDLAREYAEIHNYDYVIMDTSPSLGSLNKAVISTTDAFLIPCMPDMFSLYGIRNIGNSLKAWKKQFETIYLLLSDEKRKLFQHQFVTLLGFTIYNARKIQSGKNEYDLALAHYNYARQIPETIRDYIPEAISAGFSREVLNTPIGKTSVMHSHSTLPNMAQKYHFPMWKLPSCGELDPLDKPTISGNKEDYERTKSRYVEFAKDLIRRIEMLGSESVGS